MHFGVIDAGGSFLFVPLWYFYSGSVVSLTDSHLDMGSLHVVRVSPCINHALNFQVEVSGIYFKMC